MNKLTGTLLGGAALSVLAIAPAVASPPRFHVQALHGGRVVNKTENWHRCYPEFLCYTYTLGISTSVPASDFRKRVNLVNTFFKWCSTGSCFGEPKQRMKVPKKSKYGEIRAATVTRTFSGDQRFVFYGDAYKLTDKSGFGQTDSFVSSLKARWENNVGVKYKGTLNLDVSVAIGTE